MADSTATDSPQIVISYHVNDEKWRNRLVAQLGLAVEKFGVFDDRAARGDSAASGDFLTALRTAKVVVLLLSRKSLETSWLMMGGRLLEQTLSKNAVPIFGVMVEELPMEQFQSLQNSQLSLVNVVPLTEATEEKQNTVIRRLARELTAILEGSSQGQRASDTERTRTISELASFNLSDEVENTVERARRLATTALVRPPTVSTPCVLFGLAEGGRTESDRFRTGHFLWSELNARADGSYARLLTEEFPRLGEAAAQGVSAIRALADLLSLNAFTVFESGEQIARLTSNKPVIDGHHLLAALLLVDLGRGAIGATWPLSRLAGDLPAFRKRFFAWVVESFPDDDHEAWKKVVIDQTLTDVAEDTQEQSVSGAAEFAQPTVAGFMADEWTGRDLLGITHDVNALASLVAAYKVEPPLSIGLFGDWGSGKSHFMRQMRKRVELLSQRARESGQPQNELGYYKNIVQIEFNAWHYIEGNLWASLVDHIFQNLKFSDREDESYANRRRDELMQKLGVQKDLQDKIDLKVEACEDELRKLNERKEHAEAELQNASLQLNGFREEVKGSLKSLTVPITFTAEEKELLSRIGIDTGAQFTAADIHRNYLELRRGGNAVKAQWKLFRSDRRVVRRYLLSALLVIIAIGGPALLKLGVFPRLPTAVVTVLGFVAALLAVAKPAWDQFQTSLKALEKHDREVERERQKRITELESEVSALTKEVVAAKLESEAVGKEIDKLKDEIKHTSSTKILSEFIEDRAAASDYRRHLGLLALIRRDFEKLRDLFDEQRQEEIEGREANDEKRINRIVLYIDDLDRCPPDRVVQVLQAIHLLLAFPLFVVVVGVDSRWITRSLEQSYEWLRVVDQELFDGEKGAAENRDDKQYNGAGATPHDYLEKIFQIPFWLRSMNDDVCVEFLDGLTKEATVTAPAKFSEAVSEVRGEGVELLNIETPVAEQPLVQPSPLPVSSAETPVTNPRTTRNDIDLAPRSLTFSDNEVAYMKKLVPLIGRSPRAVKRFLNCYRLLKVGLTPAEFENFVGDEGESESYKAAMILLGVITGAPTVSSYVIDELKTWRGKEFSLETFLQSLSTNAEMAQQPDSARLLGFLHSHDFGPTSGVLFQQVVHFGPRVSRFSFRVSRGHTSR